MGKRKHGFPKKLYAFIDSDEDSDTIIALTEEDMRETDCRFELVGEYQLVGKHRVKRERILTPVEEK